MTRYFSLIIACSLFVSTNIFTQERQQLRTLNDSNNSLTSTVVSKDSAAIYSIYRDVEAGILKDELGDVLGHFSHEVYINLQGVEAGYYSANQASYILKNFFGARRVVNFKLSTVGTSEDSPYATGAGTFMHLGKREMLQLYLGLTMSEHRWVISQFNVY